MHQAVDIHQGDTHQAGGSHQGDMGQLGGTHQGDMGREEDRCRVGGRHQLGRLAVAEAVQGAHYRGVPVAAQAQGGAPQGCRRGAGQVGVAGRPGLGPVRGSREVGRLALSLYRG